jgi:HAD superfamily hydrolase (TIGR01509 family)
MAVQAIIFDCFGVLYNDAFKDFLQRNAKAINGNEGYYYDLANKSDTGQISDGAFYNALRDISGEDPAALKHEFHDTHHLNQGLVDLIRQLKPRYKIGMLSNSGREMLDEFMAEHNITDLFDCVIASSETPFIKPQREIFELIVERLQLPFSNLYFVDDSAANTFAAQSYGIQVHTYESVAELQGALQKEGIL